MQRRQVEITGTNRYGNDEYEVTIAGTREIKGEDVDIGKLGTDRYLRNPLVLWAHDQRSLPVAKTLGIERPSENSIRAKFKFLHNDPFADRVRNAWDQGFLNGASIGWDDETNELLEWSIVPVPADPEALRTSHKRMIDDLFSSEQSDVARATVPTHTREEGTTMADQAPQPTLDVAQIQNVIREVVRSEVQSAIGTLNAAATAATTARSAPEESTQTRESEPSLTLEDIADTVRTTMAAEREEADKAAAAAAATAAAQEEEKKNEEQRAAEIDTLARRRAALITRSAPFLPSDFDPMAHSNRDILLRALGRNEDDPELSEDHMEGQLVVLAGSRSRAADSRNALMQSAAASAASAPSTTNRSADPANQRSAAANRDQAKDEYVSYLQNAWREPVAAPPPAGAAV